MNIHFNLTAHLRERFEHLRRRRAESESAQFGRDARADWRLLCIVFLVVNLALIAMNIVIYARINRGEFFLVDKPEPASSGTLNRFELEKTIKFFDEKQKKFDALRR